MTFPSVNEQMDLLRQGVEQIVPEKELAEKLERSRETGQALKVKLGCDPSRPDLHLGHSVVLGKLRDFQDLGHAAVLVVGDFTAMIGDPSGRNKTRPSLSLEQTRKNGESYYEQATLVLSRERLEITYNSEWLNQVNFADLIRLASHITVARMMERDDFTKRFQAATPIALHELLYPLAQAYDSVHLKADVELGGTDQTFNLLMARDIQRAYGQSPQVILTTPLLVGTDGVEKMSKSHNNTIALTDAPDQMYGKVMSIPDALIVPYFEYCTQMDGQQLADIQAQLARPEVNPRDHKRRLAREIIMVYYDRAAAETAEEAFDRLFIQKELPEDIPEYSLKAKETFLVEVLREAGLVTSNGEGRRLVAQGAVRINGEVASDPNFIVERSKRYTVKVGKRRFLRIV